jgi:hypothetical protein
MAPGEKVQAIFTGAEIGEKGEIRFTFENSSGTLTHKIWNNYDIDPKDLKPVGTKERKQQDKDLTERCAYHIGGALLPREVLDGIEAATFDQYGKELVRHLNHASKGTECVLHVVVNKKGFVDFPKFPNFIKSIHLPESDWATDSRYHSYVKVAVDKADAEQLPVGDAKPARKLPF